jgi:hypothetical protein
MIVANMIEAVIMPRFATGTRASLLTRFVRSRKNYQLVIISKGDEFRQTSIERA